jgi:hypothetical protein
MPRDDAEDWFPDECLNKLSDATVEAVRQACVMSGPALAQAIMAVEAINRDENDEADDGHCFGGRYSTNEDHAVTLSRQPLLLLCQTSDLSRQVAITYWPINQAIGERVVRLLGVRRSDQSKQFAEALVQLTAGLLATADNQCAEEERQKHRALLCQLVPEIDGCLQNLGFLTFHCDDELYTRVPNYDERKEALKSTMTEDFCGVLHVVLCLLPGPEKKVSDSEKKKKKKKCKAKANKKKKNAHGKRGRSSDSSSSSSTF